jgi:glycine dehydrogenase
MAMTQTITKSKRAKFFISSLCNPQTIEVCQVRATPMGIDVIVGDPFTATLNAEYMGVMMPYPGTDGAIHDYTKVIEAAKVRYMQDVRF